ncbi:MAG: hypothetical protein KBS86_03795 [Proteobacteria bacterium]|nr:hypothetical protein [Candidatus Enterousia scatequi]
MNNAKKQFNSGRRAVKNKNKTWIKRIWLGLCACAQWVWNGLKSIWKWLCKINLIGLLNLALLVAIIVLFSMLVADVCSCTKGDKASAENIEPNIVVPENKRKLTTRPQLPIKQNRFYSELNEPVNVVSVKPDTVTVKQIACPKRNTLAGDIIIDNRGVASIIRNGTEINGNLYLQNMRKYVLPCNVTVNGNLFLRDLGMLQFCGKFNITGNIYVSPRSSFGPLPYDSKIGGQIIL